MAKDKAQNLINRYCRAVLYQSENLCDVKMMLQEKTDFLNETKIAEIEQWANANRHYLVESAAFANKEITKDSLEFQSFLTEIKKLNDTVLLDCVHYAYDNAGDVQEEVRTADLAALTAESLLASIQGNVPKSQAVKNYTAELNFIKTYRTWLNDQDSQQKIRDIIYQLEQESPDQAEEAKKLVAQGKQIAKIHTKAYHAGMQKNPGNIIDELIQEAKKFSPTPAELKKIKKQFEKAQSKKESFAKEKNEVANFTIPPPEFDVDGLHLFAISNLEPSETWTVMIDETGNVFDQKIFDNKVSDKDKGKFVAILLPQEHKLPPVGSFHATDDDTIHVANTLLDLLQKGKGCGILGVTLEKMACADVNYWYNGLERIAGMIFRLLPTIPGKNTTLDFYVEKRGDTNTDMVRLTLNSALYQYVKAYGNQKDYTIHCQCIAKMTTADKTFIGWNGYADAVACAWNGRRNLLKKILEVYNLRYTCLMEGEEQTLTEMMDRLKQGESIPPGLWNKLLAVYNQGKRDSLAIKLLTQLGHQLRSDCQLWQEYVQDTIGHLNSKAINMRKLAKQVNYLTEYMPAESIMPKRMKLAWLTVKLAEANHRGEIVMQAAEEFKNLIHDLYEEDAPLTCWAVLHLAVHYTNSFQFQRAKDLISDYSDIGMLIAKEPPFARFLKNTVDMISGYRARKDNYVPAAIPGLRYYGQLLSSFGQHEAFLGNPEKACQYFQEAIECFKRLSEDRDRDIAQTFAYYVTSQMDIDSRCEETKKAMEKYLQTTLKNAVCTYPANNDDSLKYHHHIFLRYLADLGANNPLGTQYAKQEKVWNISQGHPWEMIEFYRALLCQDATLRAKHLKKALEIANEGGATLRVIACVIQGAIFFFNRTAKEKELLQTLTEQVIREIPDLGEKRVDALKQQACKPLPPLDFAKIVLPFNFR